MSIEEDIKALQLDSAADNVEDVKPEEEEVKEKGVIAPEVTEVEVEEDTKGHKEELESENVAAGATQLPTPQAYPYYMVSGDNREWTFYSFTDCLKRSYEQSYTTEIVADGCELANIFPCCNGWLLLQGVRIKDDSQTWHLSLLNIATWEKIKLPELDSNLFQPSYTFVMTAPPTAADCALVLCSYTRPLAVIWRPGQQKWSKLSSDPAITLSYLSVCGNKLYGIIPPPPSSRRPHLVVCDIADDTLTATSVVQGPPNYGYKLSGDKYLVESRGDIFWIEMFIPPGNGSQEKFPGVFKLDQTTKTWTPVDAIGDRVFFLSRGYSSSCSTANSDIRGDYIYFIDKYEAYTYNMFGHSIGRYFPHGEKFWGAPPLFTMVAPRGSGSSAHP